MSNFEQMLSGGHPNSLGNTVEVVNQILADKTKLKDLYSCYFSKDEVVRLRVSNAFKRITRDHLDWFKDYIDKFISEISKIDQASTKWTIANLFDYSTELMTPAQLKKAKEIVKHNLATENDWIVLKNSMDTLGKWAKEDEELKQWLKPHLKRLQKYSKKVVPNTAKKWEAELGLV
jgi:UDP-N-acetylmuramoylalanine-D-glutamate ligase